MRIVVKLPPQAYPELQAELERLPARQRAERLRLLASIGLLLCQSGAAPVGVVLTMLKPQPEGPSATLGASRFRGIKERLKSSIER